MAEASQFAKSLKSPFQWIAAALIVLFVVLVALGPILRSLTKKSVSSSVQDARVIALAMVQYEQDHNGAYPTGKSSTEVFQKLIDEHYVQDPTTFWIMSFNVPGKTKATSNELKPENVCWDVTVPLDAGSSDLLPVVFLTGYRINYVPGGSAVPLFSSSEDRPPGIAVCYHGNNPAWLKNDGQPDRIVKNFISTAFDPAGKKYQQLTPDGPLP